MSNTTNPFVSFLQTALIVPVYILSIFLIDLSLIKLMSLLLSLHPIWFIVIVIFLFGIITAIISRLIEAFVGFLLSIAKHKKFASITMIVITLANFLFLLYSFLIQPIIGGSFPEILLGISLSFLMLKISFSIVLISGLFLRGE